MDPVAGRWVGVGGGGRKQVAADQSSLLTTHIAIPLKQNA